MKSDGKQAARAASRQDVYRFLATLYTRPPTVAMVRRICNRHFLRDLTTVFGARNTHWLKEFARGFDGDHDRLERDFRALLLAPAASYVGPHQPVHIGPGLDGERRGLGILMGPRTGAKQSLPADGGFARSVEGRDLGSFLEHELDFMARLCGLEAQAAAAGDGEGVASSRWAQLAFLDRHMGRWIGDLAERIQAEADTHFYKGVAELTRAFVRRDLGALRKVPDPQVRSA